MKKIIAIAMIVILAVTAVIGGTYAYFTDTDAQDNVFTTGTVEIDLWEDFGDNDEESIEKLLPAVGSAQDGTLKNGVEKEVYVENIGEEDTYVRVHIAIPQILDDGWESFDASANVLHFNYAPESVGEGKWDWSDRTGEVYTGEWNFYTAEITDDEGETAWYNVYVVTYESALKPGETTVDAISQVYLDSQTEQSDIAEINAVLGKEWHIYVAAEAGQAAGFENAYEALNEQFGVPGTYNVGNWTNSEGKEYVESVSSEEELIAALANGGEIALTADIAVTDVNGLAVAKDTVLNLNGHDIAAAGDALVVTDGTLTINGDGVVTAGNGGAYCAVWANGGAVVINGGTYVGGKDAAGVGNDTIYTKNGGTVAIYGGTFSAELNTESYAEGQHTCLNENDSNRGTITVCGGTFEAFDPADNVSEGAGTSFVADGYKSVDNGDGTWTVVAE